MNVGGGIFSRSSGRLAAKALAGVISKNGSQSTLSTANENGSDPAARFAEYRSNVVASLVTALGDTFPVINELVGQEFFHAMARVFVAEAQPHGTVLTFYGETFPDFITDFTPATSVPYLADFARLEMLRVHLYHAHNALPIEQGALEALLYGASMKAPLTSLANS